MVETFADLINLAIWVKKLKEPSEENYQKVIAGIRRLSERAFGYPEVGWGIFKLGVAGIIILGAIAGIVAAAILVKPAFLVLLMVVFGATAYFCLVSGFNPFSDFYKKGFSKELDKFADRIQYIINAPDPKAILASTTQQQGETAENSFRPMLPSKSEKIDQPTARVTKNSSSGNYTPKV